MRVFFLFFFRLSCEADRDQLDAWDFISEEVNSSGEMQGELRFLFTSLMLFACFFFFFCLIIQRSRAEERLTYSWQVAVPREIDHDAYSCLTWGSLHCWPGNSISFLQMISKICMYSLLRANPYCQEYPFDTVDPVVFLIQKLREEIMRIFS